MRGGSIFVLTVDDDAAFARAAARSFESVGMRTFLALDPGVPFDGSEPIDVIVTDRAGEPRSLALAQMIKKRGPRGPIILMTAQPDTFRRAAIGSGAVAAAGDRGTLPHDQGPAGALGAATALICMRHGRALTRPSRFACEGTQVGTAGFCYRNRRVKPGDGR